MFINQHVSNKIHIFFLFACQEHRSTQTVFLWEDQDLVLFLLWSQRVFHHPQSTSCEGVQSTYNRLAFLIQTRIHKNCQFSLDMVPKHMLLTATSSPLQQWLNFPISNSNAIIHSVSFRRQAFLCHHCPFCLHFQREFNLHNRCHLAARVHT